MIEFFMVLIFAAADLSVKAVNHAKISCYMVLYARHFSIVLVSLQREENQFEVSLFNCTLVRQVSGMMF